MVQKKQTQKEPELDAPSSPRELVENLKEMIDEAESMIIETASHQMDETVEELREQLQERIDRLKATYQQAEERVMEWRPPRRPQFARSPTNRSAWRQGLASSLGYC